MTLRTCSRRRRIFSQGSFPCILLLAFTASGFGACGGKTKNGTPPSREPGSDDNAGDGGSGGHGGGDPITGGAKNDGSGGGGQNGTGGVPPTGEGGAQPVPWTVSSPLPPDDRPPPPDYELPFEVGDVGWQGSIEPVCDPLQGGAQAQSVWADDRGVFALVSMGCNAIAKQPCGAAGSAIYQNAGGGWERLFFQDVDADGAIAMELKGIHGGPLVLAGSEFLLFDPEHGFESLDIEAGAIDFSVHEETIYFIQETSPKESIWRFEDGDSTLLAELDESASLFALADGVMLGMRNRMSFLDEDGSLNDIAGAPAGRYGPIWANSKDDFWVAQSGPYIARYDGTWTILHQVAGDGNVRALWGQGDRLYYSSDYEIGMIDDEGVHELAVSADYDDHFERLSFDEVWGRSEDEVFFTYRYHLLDEYKCGGFGLLWYDGAGLHRF